MVSCILPIKPYNDIWIDCVINNLISILTNENEKNKKITLYFEVKYIKRVLDQRYDSEDSRKQMIYEGQFVPKVLQLNHKVRKLTGLPVRGLPNIMTLSL